MNFFKTYICIIPFVFFQLQALDKAHTIDDHLDYVIQDLNRKVEVYDAIISSIQYGRIGGITGGILFFGFMVLACTVGSKWMPGGTGIVSGGCFAGAYFYNSQLPELIKEKNQFESIRTDALQTLKIQSFYHEHPENKNCISQYQEKIIQEHKTLKDVWNQRKESVLFKIYLAKTNRISL
jgi:hypothetical protein